MCWRMYKWCAGFANKGSRPPKRAATAAFSKSWYAPPHSFKRIAARRGSNKRVSALLRLNPLADQSKGAKNLAKGQRRVDITWLLAYTTCNALLHVLVQRQRHTM